MIRLRGAYLYVWLAALIDGEGSIMFVKRVGSKKAKVRRNPHYRAVVSIATADYRLMEALIKQTGIDRVYQHRINGDPRTPMKRASWTWRLTSEDIQEWLPRVLPYLVLKQQQAKLLLEAIKIKNKLTPGSPAYNFKEWQRLVPRLHLVHAEITKLNRAGRVTLTKDEAICSKVSRNKAKRRLSLMDNGARQVRAPSQQPSRLN